MNRPLARVNICVVLVVLTACASALSASPGIAVTDPKTAEPRAISPAIPVEQLLRADGTLDLHRYRGSASTAGWRMRTGADGAPVFEPGSGGAGIESPESADRPVAASGGDVCVDDEFGGSNGTNGSVYALALDGGGNLYVGGSFTTAGGVSASYIARWNGASWSALGAGMNERVNALALDGGGNLYAGGWFTEAGNVSARRIARWNGTSWSALGSGLSGHDFIGNEFAFVTVLVVDGGGDLYAGGDFTTAGGASANRIARWNGTSWSALGAGMNNTVDALALDGGGNLYAGGGFTTAGSVSASYVARWNGSSWSRLGAGMNNSVEALAVDGGGNLYAGGFFTAANGVSASRIARWNGSSWSGLGAGMDADVRALALDGGGNLYAGGVFTMAGGVSANRIARWNGTSWSPLGAGMDADVGALALDGSNLYAGGSFTSAGGKPSSRVAEYHLVAYRDADGDGYGDPTISIVDLDCSPPAGYVANNNDCDDSNPAVPADYHRDADGDGYGDPAISILACSAAGYVANDTDCDDSNAAVHPGAVEACNGLDENCDGHMGEVYRDADGDGYGDPAISMPLDLDCSPPSGYAINHTDCDDSNAAVHPGVDACNGIDDNCDGRVDEIQEPGLVGWWKGEGNANDNAGSNHGTLRNGAAFVGGMAGQCFGLDGIDDYIDDLGTASTFAFIQNTGVFTIDAWIALDDPNALREQTLTANIASLQEKGHLFEIVNSSGQHGLRFALAGVLIIDSRSPNDIITGDSWHHVAATGNGTNVTFYVDAVAYPGSGTMVAVSGGNATRAVDIGWDGIGSYYGGQLDELAIHDRTLSAGEIQAIYNTGAAGRCAVAGVAGVDEPRPTTRTFEFAAPWPNPAMRSTTIRFHLPSAARVRVDVFDLVGRRVRSPIDGQYLTAGEHRVSWDGDDASGQRVAPGIYEVRITTGAAVGVRRIVMLE